MHEDEAMRSSVDTGSPDGAPARAGTSRAACRLATIQGSFLILTGVWPLVAYRSFERLTGPKKEPWLVKTVGLLLASWGVLLIRHRRDAHAPLASLGSLPGLALAGVDIWYAGARRIISPVYLLDAALEVGWAVAWADVAARKERD